jgi:hypothetical protein
LASKIKGETQDTVDGLFLDKAVPGYEKVRYIKAEGPAKSEDAARDTESGFQKE